MPGIPLILSLFPGLDLLGRAFEEQGCCVVRGPDVIFGSDIKRFHPPADRFEGLIGGPPCQAFSRLKNIVLANGHSPKFGNLIPEFARCIEEAMPIWWLMEEVPEAPLLSVSPQWQVESFLLTPRHLGDPQSRLRRFTIGCRDRIPNIWCRLPLVALEPVEIQPAICGEARSRPIAIGGNGKRKRPLPKSKGGRRMSLTEAATIQGFPELGEVLPGPWTIEGASQAIGNGVPKSMGAPIARAILEWRQCA